MTKSALLLVSVLISVAVSSIFAAEAETEAVIPTETVYGIEYETDESWLVYQRVAPIIYKYEVPATYPEFFDQLLNKYARPCSRPDTAKKLQGWCPMMTTLKQLGSYFESALSLQQDLSAPESVQPNFLDLHCQRIRKSFPSLQTDEAALEDYLSDLKNCTGALFIEENGILPRNESEPAFSSILNLLLDSYFEAVGPTNTPKETFVNGEIIPTTLGFLIYFAETQRWKSAITDCKVGTIPRSLVQQSQLQASLEKLQKILADKFDENLVIDRSDEEIGEYFTRQITDCTFSGSTFVVRILVPVKQGNPQLHQIRSLPFLSRNSSICFNSQFKTEKNIVYDFTSGSVLESDCLDKTQLCYSPLLSYSNAYFNQNDCAKALFSYPVDNATFESVCTLTCDPVTVLTNLPLIRKTARNSYHVVGEFPKAFSIEIDASVKAAENRTVFDTQLKGKDDARGKTTKIVKFSEFGALQVTIPCNSRLILEKYGRNLTFFAMSPCTNELEVNRVQLYQLA